MQNEGLYRVGSRCMLYHAICRSTYPLIGQAIVVNTGTMIVWWLALEWASAQQGGYINAKAY